MVAALLPKIGKAWEVGLHQCSRERIWTTADQLLFKGICRRMADGLSSMLLFRELSRAKHYIENVIDSMPSVLLGVDVHGRITQWNFKAERETGVMAKEAIGQEFYRLFPHIGQLSNKIKAAIEDAQILKILSNRIIIIRSNGQQETLYLREEDAVCDFNKEAKSIPKSVIENNSNNKYTINIDEFIKRVRNLGEFINLLDLTTVYKQGKSFGCRIGKIDKDSLGFMLGLMVDDIIVKIDNYFIDDLANRIHVYDHITQKHVGDVIDVVLYRGQDVMTLQYGLIDNVSKNVVFTPQQTHQKLMAELNKHEAHYLPTEKPVVIQSMSQDEDDTMNPESLNFDEDFLQNNDIMQQTAKISSNKSISAQIENAQVKIQSSDSQNVSELQKNKQKLMQEHNKLKPTLQNMKSKDKNNMMKRSSRNVIFDKMQQ